ncbi:MAG: hypothetical protein ACKVXR_15460 [Planctomycetota bacterium]
MSKKRSASRQELERRLEQVEFFIERSVGSEILAAALRGAGAKVHLHADFFEDAAPDEEWLTMAGTRRWVVIHRDTRIVNRPIEIEALIAAGVQAFVFDKGNMKMPELSRMVVGYLPTMRRWAVKKPAPFIGKITGNGLRLIHPKRPRREDHDTT